MLGKNINKKYPNFRGISTAGKVIIYSGTFVNFYGMNWSWLAFIACPTRMSFLDFLHFRPWRRCLQSQSSRAITTWAFNTAIGTQFSITHDFIAIMTQALIQSHSQTASSFHQITFKTYIHSTRIDEPCAPASRCFFFNIICILTLYCFDYCVPYFHSNSISMCISKNTDQHIPPITIRNGWFWLKAYSWYDP